jgi:hypothetical protein
MKNGLNNGANNWRNITIGTIGLLTIAGAAAIVNKSMKTCFYSVGLNVEKNTTTNTNGPRGNDRV